MCVCVVECVYTCVVITAAICSSNIIIYNPSLNSKTPLATSHNKIGRVRGWVGGGEGVGNGPWVSECGVGGGGGGGFSYGKIANYRMR